LSNLSRSPETLSSAGVPGIVATLSLIALTSVGLGWVVGFRPEAGYLWFWLLGTCAAVASWRAARRVWPDDALSGALIRTSTIAFALVVAGEMLLGALGQIRLLPHLLLFGVVGAASLMLAAPPARLRIPNRAPLLLLAALAPMLIFIVATGVTRSPLTLYDSLSYHLVFPARWLLDHRLSIVPTPFSDEAQAYAPANGELFFLWLMLPFHGDLLARIGQLPFYLLGGVALYVLARRAGAPPLHAIYPPLFYLFTRPIVEQALGADVDLVCWAMFLTSIYFSLDAVDRDERRDWLLWGVSVGLFCGSKYVALVYAPVLLAFALRGGLRRRMVWALPGILLFAAPWYARNWIAAGSPLYPASLTIGGLTLARGAYTRQAMAHSVFHTTNLRLLPAIAAHAMGTNLTLLWIPAAAAGVWAMIARQRRIAAGLAVAPAAMALLFWFGVPDNGDGRFLLPAAMLALLPFAFVFRKSRVWNACVHAAFAAGILWLVTGSNRVLPFALPWYMDGWLSLQGIVGREYWPWLLAMELAAVALVWSLRRTPGRAAAVMMTMCAAASVVFTIGSETWCVPDRCAFLTPSSIFLRSDMVVAWRWVSDHLAHATIANAGNNVPYPLFGDHLTNRVYYVNIDRHRDWRFDDYDRAHKRRRPEDPPATDPLAVPSGVLLPLAGDAVSQYAAVRPRFERVHGMRDAWIDNLKARGVGVLFVTALSAYEIDYNWHDARGFPIEAAWAQSDPEAFTLLYDNAQAEVYAVHAR
jgi:hypothetical protein